MSELGNITDGASRLKRLEDLPRRRATELSLLVGNQPIETVVESDLLSTGRYGASALLLTRQRLLAVEDGKIRHDIELSTVASAHCRDFVGNGVIEARLKEARRVELMRYSKTHAEAFRELADRINKLLSVSQDEIEARDDEIAKLVAKEDTRTYRCANCDHPLQHVSDVCPMCTSKRQVMFRLAKMMKEHVGQAIISIILSLLVVLAGLAPPYMIRILIDKVLTPFGYAELVQDNQLSPGQDWHTVQTKVAPQQRQDIENGYQSRLSLLWRLIAVLGLSFGAARIITHFRIRVMGRLGERIVTDLRFKLYRTLQRLSLSYYDREHTGRIMSRVLTDTRMVQRFVTQSVQDMVTDVLTVIGIAAVLFYEDWRLAAMALLPIPLVVLVTKHFSNRFRGVFRSVRRKFATLSAGVAETLSGMRVVKSFGQENREIDQFEEKNNDVFNAQVLAVQARSFFQPIVQFLLNIGVVSVWLFGSILVLDGYAGHGPMKLTLGILTMFIAFMNQFYEPVRRLMDVTEAFQEASTAAERVFSVMDMPSEVGDSEQAKPMAEMKGHIKLENVTFGYLEGERVIKNLSLEVKPGEMIGLVGQTGSGKSTLVSLVCRFYEPQKGRISIDGIDLRNIQITSLRHSIGMVLQEPFLFAGTIKENIAYGRHEATSAEIIRAAKAANAHDFIMNLPDGYDSEVGERGVMLSGGEKQRLSIARAILKDPAVLILDEATSSVDTVTEHIIQEAMDRVVAGRTTIAIAHRLSTLRNADRLIVLDHGEIVEQGTHEELLAYDGVYAKLVKIQAQFASIVQD